MSFNFIKFAVPHTALVGALRLSVHDTNVNSNPTSHKWVVTITSLEKMHNIVIPSDRWWFCMPWNLCVHISVLLFFYLVNQNMTYSLIWSTKIIRIHCCYKLWSRIQNTVLICFSIDCKCLDQHSLFWHNTCKNCEENQNESFELWNSYYKWCMCHVFASNLPNILDKKHGHTAWPQDLLHCFFKTSQNSDLDIHILCKWIKTFRSRLLK